MGTRTATALAALLLGAVLAGCGTTDAEINEARAVAEAKASPMATQWEPRPCPGGEILQRDANGAMDTIKPDCFDQAVVEAIAEFPEPLPPGTDWQLRTPGFTEPQQNPAAQMPSIEDGIQDTLVAGYWLCAWMDSYLQAVDGDDPAGQADGMAYLSKFTQLPAIQANMVNAEVFDSNVIAPARDGDPATVREYFKTCSNYRL